MSTKDARFMQDIADELGYSNVSSVFHYIDRRGLRWNQL